MNNPHTIQYLRQEDIDKSKWDACINNASNCLIYGNSFYLDHFSKNWDALVLNDYEMVMPLTWNRKYGFYYLYQPYFLAQLGIFGNNITPGITDIFLNNIPKKFRLWDIDLHENNHPDRYLKDCYTRVNIHLQLGYTYETIYQRYHRLTLRMLKKAKEAGISITENAEPEENLIFYRIHYPGIMNLTRQNSNKLINTFKLIQERNELISLSIRKGKEMIGMYMLLKDAMNIYSVIGGSSPSGKKSGAFYYLTDYAIQMCSNKNMTFRFEGSDKKGIAAFNRRFGAEPLSYLHLKVNKLPPIIRNFK
jgi:hypothetical protein